MDSEKTVINSIQIEFSQTKIQGCFFFYSNQVFSRRIPEYGLSTRCCSDFIFALELKKNSCTCLCSSRKGN